MSDNTTGDMPDLPPNERNIEQRRVIKFWVDHSARLEEDRNRWKKLFIEMYEMNSGVTDEMMDAYRATKNT
jgi:hypothetical protein